MTTEERSSWLNLTFTADTNKLTARCRVGRLDIDFLVDSGANASILPYEMVEDCGLLPEIDKSFRARLLNPVAEFHPTVHGRLRI